MPMLVRFIMTALLMVIEPIISRILGAIGIGFVAYTGMRVLMNQMEDAIRANLDRLPHDILSILGMAGIGQAISIVLSALMIRAYLAGMNSAGSIIHTRLGVPGK